MKFASILLSILIPLSWADMKVSAGLRLDLFSDELKVMVMDAELQKAMQIIVDVQQKGYNNIKSDEAKANLKQQRREQKDMPLYMDKRAKDYSIYNR